MKLLKELTAAIFAIALAQSAHAQQPYAHQYPYQVAQDSGSIGGYQQPPVGAGSAATLGTAVPSGQLAALQSLSHRQCSLGFPDLDNARSASISAPPLQVGRYEGMPYKQPLIIDVRPDRILFSRLRTPKGGGREETVAVTDDGQGAYRSGILDLGATLTSIAQCGTDLCACYKTGSYRYHYSGTAAWVILQKK